MIMVHGRRFEIEVADWERPEDANRIATIVHNWLQGLSAEQVAKLHTELSTFQEDATSKDDKMTGPVLEAFQACEAATKALFDEWGFVPESGHQCFLYAR